MPISLQVVARRFAPGLNRPAANRNAEYHNNFKTIHSKGTKNGASSHFRVIALSAGGDKNSKREESIGGIGHRASCLWLGRHARQNLQTNDRHYYFDLLYTKPEVLTCTVIFSVNPPEQQVRIADSQICWAKKKPA